MFGRIRWLRGCIARTRRVEAKGRSSEGLRGGVGPVCRLHNNRGSHLEDFNDLRRRRTLHEANLKRTYVVEHLWDRTGTSGFGGAAASRAPAVPP